MELTFSLFDRLSYLAAIAPGIEAQWADYSRVFQEGRVQDSKGRVVGDLPPRLQRVRARVLRSVQAFADAAAELAIKEEERSRS